MIMRSLVLATLLSTLPACGDDDPERLFTPDVARLRVERFLKAVVEDDMQRALNLCAPPFRFHQRTWKEETWRKNLEAKLRDLTPAIAETDDLEAFGYDDLMAGRWPRSRTVPEDQRSAAIDHYKISKDGYLVRSFPRGKKGLLFVLDRQGASLVIRGLIP